MFLYKVYFLCNELYIYITCLLDQFMKDERRMASVDMPVTLITKYVYI